MKPRHVVLPTLLAIAACRDSTSTAHSGDSTTTYPTPASAFASSRSSDARLAAPAPFAPPPGSAAPASTTAELQGLAVGGVAHHL